MRHLLTILFSIACFTAIAQGDNPQFKGFGLTRWDTTAADVSNQRPPAVTNNAEFMYNWRSGRIQVKIAGVWYNLAVGNVTGSVANATPTTAGKAKLFTTTGSGTDGAMDQNSVTNALNLKAPLTSPALTGTPTAPTASVGTNTTQIATTAHVKASIDNYQSLPAYHSYSADQAITLGDINIANGTGVIRIPAGAGSGIDFTITTNATVALPQRTLIVFDNQSSNNITIKFASGVTGVETVIPPGSVGNIFQYSTDAWDVFTGSGGGGISSCPATYTTYNASHALVLGDFATCNGEGVMTFNGTGPYTLTVNTNATTAIPVDYVMGIINESTNDVTVAFAVGVSHTELSLVIPSKSTAYLKKYATDGWYLLGTGTTFYMSGVSVNEIPKSPDGSNLGPSGIFTNAGTTIFGPGSSIIQAANGTSGNPAGYNLTVKGGDAYATGNNAGGVLLLGGGINNGTGAVGFQENSGAQNFATTTITTTTTIGYHYTIRVNATSGAVTVNLPTAASAFQSNTGRVYVIKRIDNVTANAITVDPSGSETIDGSSTKVLAGQYDWIVIQSNGTSWDLIGQN